MAFTLEDLYVAYRKAKVEAYYDGNIAHGVKFANYEAQLVANLEVLLQKVNGEWDWCKDTEQIGGLLAIPKAPRFPIKSPNAWHFTDSDPTADWIRSENPTSPTILPFRNVIDPTVDFLVTSTLWVLKVGSVLEAGLASQHVYANRIDRVDFQQGAPNLGSHKLFRNWSTQYKKWQARGLDAIKTQLSRGVDVLVFNMDLRSFFHEIDPAFITTVLDSVPPDEDTADRTSLTTQLLSAMETWHLRFVGGRHGVPVGLPSSGVFANVLLKQLDTEMADLDPVYYGRYVDDMFLVLPAQDGIDSGEGALAWLSERLPSLAFDPNQEGDGGLRLSMDLHADLLFSREKLSVLRLAGQSGMELLAAVEEQMSARASEQRLKPSLSADPVELGRRALMLMDGQHREVSEIKHARGIALKRAAFSQILRLMERYEIDLPPEAWRTIRESFYGLALRHALTPEGLHIYFRRLPWLFGLMIFSRDYADAEAFLVKLETLRVSLGYDSEDQSRLFWEGMQRHLSQEVMAAVVVRTRGPNELHDLLSSINRRIAPWTMPPNSQMEGTAESLILADWARTPYSTLWVSSDAPRGSNTSPPTGLLAPEVASFTQVAQLSEPDWRPIAFPTRPLDGFEISTRLPVEAFNDLAKTVQAFRGSDAYSIDVEVTTETRGGFQRVRVGSPYRVFRRNMDSAIIAVASMEISDNEWEDSLKSPVPLTEGRYRRMRRILTETLASKGPVDYLVLPELSLPRRWVKTLTEQLATNGISLIAGVEYGVIGTQVHNQAVVSLWSGSTPPFPVVRFETKTAAAWHERDELSVPTPPARPRPGYTLVPSMGKPNLYEHSGFHFAALICSDLTNIELRAPLRGQIDALFVLEWNPDVDGFSAIVESSASDLHAFVIQVNNRQYGDSWIRAPFCERFRRDVLRVKGGWDDYVVLGRINFQQLREFQDKRPTMSCKEQAGQGLQPGFKPVPIAFALHPLRKP